MRENILRVVCCGWGVCQVQRRLKVFLLCVCGGVNASRSVLCFVYVSVDSTNRFREIYERMRADRCQCLK
jgi:hypothetical protein